MKILHLADLHIGKTLLEQSLIEDQEYMLEKILNFIKKEKIEVVMISGDVYDKSIPSTDAVNLLDSFLNSMIKDLKIKVLVISGNHDSKDRLGFGNKIFEDEGLYIASKYDGQIKKIELEDKFGKINFYMLPFVKPIDVRRYFDDEIKSYDEAIKKIIDNEDINEDERNIIMVHQFVTAGTISPDRTESEILSLGGTDNVDVSNFDKFDYVAIGHVHRNQKIGRDTARYAGTILKYSFSEANHEKKLTILDYKEKDNLIISFKELKPLRDLREIKGPIEELLKEENYKDTNTDDYIRVIITNEEPIYDAIGQIRKVYPNVLKLELQNSKTKLNFDYNIENIDSIKKKTELELFNDFYKEQNNIELNEEQIKLIEDVIKEERNEAD